MRTLVRHFGFLLGSSLFAGVSSWLAPRALPLVRVLGAGGAILLVVIAAGWFALPFAWRRGCSRRAPLPTGVPLRTALYAITAAILASWLSPWLGQGWSPVAAALALATSLGLWSVLLACAPRQSGVLRVLDRVGLVVMLTVGLLEAVLRLCSWLGVASILVLAEAGPERFVKSAIFPPGTPVFGSHTNSGGFYDEEFQPPGPQRGPIVAMIGDSFVAGIVPHPHLFSTVSEPILGMPVYSMGVGRIGPPEYLWLLQTTALPLQPAAVVVCVFVGNDLTAVHPGSAPWWLPLLDPDVGGIPRVVRRVLVLQREGRPKLAERSDADVQPENLVQRFPWIADWSLEPPTMSAGSYAQLKKAIARLLGQPGLVDYDVLFHYVRAMRAECGRIPFALVLIPDELQVEEALWPEWGLEPAAGIAARDLVQRTITSFCAAERIPCLDLLPVLRQAPREPDGRLHVYHNRDSHLNVKGSRLVGVAIGEFLRPLLPAR